MTRRLTAIFAHPDDDTYGIGGTAALAAADPGFELRVVLATSGEAGLIADESLATRENLGRVREAEDRGSWKALGVEPASLEFLRFPDGGLAVADRPELKDRLVALLTEAPPDVVATFGPDGVTGHEDHVAIGGVATEAFHEVRAGAQGDGLERLLYVGLPQSKLGRFAELLRERGIDPPDPTQPFQPRGVPDETIAFQVDCSAVYERKLAALREHRTQGELQDVPFDLWPLVLSGEAFVQAWPQREPDAPVLTDPFEDLTVE